ncbi:MAG: DUF72 domain-containing protein [Gammaproteobacteria bacterium]
MIIAIPGARCDAVDRSYGAAGVDAGKNAGDLLRHRRSVDTWQSARGSASAAAGFRSPKKGYFEHFPVLEVQQTFYQSPRIETWRRWRSAAPADFEFTLKAWQLMRFAPDIETLESLRRRL